MDNARWYDNSLGRFAQADSIIPAGVQGYDRYAYVSNNPLKYTDPTGHMVACDCDGNGNTTIFFGGSNTNDINLPGPRSPMWETDPSGNPVKVVQYPGSSRRAEKDDGRPYTVPGKTQQAIDAQGLLPNANVNLIAYSAGTESALMYAQWRLDNNQVVNSIVLLGPTFQTSSMNFNEPDGGWSAVMDDLIEQGVNIYVLDDDLDEDIDIAGYQPPTCSSCGAYKMDRDAALPHYSERPTALWGLLQGTNNSPRIKGNVYSWLANSQ